MKEWRGGRTLAAGSLILVLAFTFILFNPQLYAEETVIVNKDFNGREIKVRAGGMIRVDLEEIGSTGYSWIIQDLDNELFEVVSVRTENPPPASDVTGKPVIKTWEIRAKKAGLGEIKILQYRPWEGKEKAAGSFFLKVLII